MSREHPFGYPPHPAEEGRISVADMAELIHAGLAVPLLAEFNVGPTLYEGVWWWVPQGRGEPVRGYCAAGPELAAELTARWAQLRALDASVAATQEQRRAAAAAGRPFPDVPDEPWDYEPHPVDTNPFTRDRPEAAGRRRSWWAR
jgi:hypothetical protein